MSYRPELAKNIIFDNEKINEAIQEIKNLKRCKALNKVREKLIELARRSPRNRDVLQYCSTECDDIMEKHGYLRCLLELHPSDGSCKRSEILTLTQSNF